jgi:hypothetical protein
MAARSPAAPVPITRTLQTLLRSGGTRILCGSDRPRTPLPRRPDRRRSATLDRWRSRPQPAGADSASADRGATGNAAASSAATGALTVTDTRGIFPASEQAVSRPAGAPLAPSWATPTPTDSHAQLRLNPVRRGGRGRPVRSAGTPGRIPGSAPCGRAVRTRRRSSCRRWRTLPGRLG